MKPLCNANLEVLDQLTLLVRHTLNVYTETSDDLHASIGQHVRHILDHYHAVKTGVACGCINYNLRNRNSPVEHCPQTALSMIGELQSWLGSCDFADEAIPVISEICLNRTESEQLPSNIQRELLYLINHSIHHMAYSALLAKQMNIPIPKNIGMAPGTLTYMRTHQEEATHA